jgi:hypothetical protein
MKTLRLTLGLLAASSLGACATNRLYDPFFGQPGAMASVRTIAVSSAELPKDLPNRATVQQQLDSAVSAQLQSFGYRVISPAQVEPVWRSLADTAKIFDPVTGELDSARAIVIERAMAREVAARFGADAWLVPGYRLRQASYRSGWCAWDGTKQYVQTKGELLKLAVLGMTKSGTVPALSLRVAVSDSSGRTVFLNHGGLQALVRVTAGGTEHLKPSQVFDDRERNVKAVELALEPLVKPMTKQ